MIEAILFVKGRLGRSFFYSSPSHPYKAQDHVVDLKLSLYVLRRPLKISSLSRRGVILYQTCMRVRVSLYDCKFEANLAVLSMHDFDVILGMDLLPS